MNHSLARKLPLTWLAGLALAASPAAQVVTPLLLDGEDVDGLGEVNNITAMSVNDDGEWLALAQLRDAGGTTFTAAVLNRSAVLITGDIMANTGGEELRTFVQAEIDEDVNLLWSLRSNGAVGMDEYLFNAFQALGVEGQMPQTSALSAYTWSSFDHLKVGNDGYLIVQGRLAPTAGGQQVDYLVRQRLDGSGALVEETLLLLEGEPLDGRNVRFISLNRVGEDLACGGPHWAAFVEDDGDNAEDAVLVVDGAVVLREGSASPLTGFTWGPLDDPAVDIRADGSWLAQADVSQLADEFEVLVRDGAVVLQVGDTLPTSPPTAITDFGGTSPVHLGADGGVVYIARTDSGDPNRDAVIARGTRVLVQEGVTEVDGVIVESLRFGDEAIELSASGRFLLFRATLSTGVAGLFQIDLGSILPMESCQQNAGTLQAVDGLPLLGETVTFELDGEQDVGVTPVFLLSNAPIVGWPPCGLASPFGELLIDVTPARGNPGVALIGAPTDGSPVQFQVDVPTDLALLESDYYAQGLFWDFGDQSPAENLRLTNGLEIALAPR